VALRDHGHRGSGSHNEVDDDCDCANYSTGIGRCNFQLESAYC
jgi:hypothetical protein